MRKILALALALGLAALFAAAPADAAPERYRWASGPAGGGWNPAVGAATQFLNTKLGDKYNFTAMTSQGSIENIRRIGTNQIQIAWAHVVQMWEQWHGKGQFEKDGAKQTFRVVANIYAQAQNIVVLKDSPIKTYADMAGKRVNLLTRGSGSFIVCRDIFTSLGLIDKIQPRYLNFESGMNALGDGQLDVFCGAGTPNYTPAIAQLSVLKPLRFVSMTEADQKMISGKFPFYLPFTIPPIPDEVKGVDTPTRTIKYDVWWIVNSKVSDRAVYEMVKTINENLQQLSQAAVFWKYMNGDFQALKAHKMLAHPAAARYWKEKGVKVPDEVVKGFD